MNKIEKSKQISRAITKKMDTFNKDMKSSKTPKQIVKTIKGLLKK